MIHIRSIATFPSMSQAYDKWTALIASFKRVHQRGEKVDLFIASSGDVKSPTIEITVHYTSEHEAEAAWFAREVVK